MARAKLQSAGRSLCLGVRAVSGIYPDLSGEAERMGVLGEWTKELQLGQIQAQVEL